MSVRTILRSALDRGFDGRNPAQWTALVVLTEMESGGNPAAVQQHFPLARRYPAWSTAETLRYTPRIILRTPVVTAEMVRLGITIIPDVAEEAAGAVTDPIVEIAREPLRILQWLTDPGTLLRVIKVIGGGVLIIVGLALAARPATEAKAGQIVGTIVKARTGGKGKAL